MPAFQVGSYYTNDEIVAVVGGVPQPYLRYTANNEIVAACLNPGTNPKAPHEIWAGQGDGVDIIGQSADWFAAQCAANPSKAVPLFIKDPKVYKKGEPRWVYKGRYRVTRKETSPAELALRKRRTPVTRILMMQRVSD